MAGNRGREPEPRIAEGVPTQPVYGLRFWFEWHTLTAFWPENDAAYARFGLGEIDPDELPLSAETRQRVREVAAWHDTSLNWEYPPDPGPWRQDECDRFNAAVADLYRAVVRELGAAYAVVNAQPALREDPDLDAYLRNPQGFRRNQRDRESSSPPDGDGRESDGGH